MFNHSNAVASSLNNFFSGAAVNSEYCDIGEDDDYCSEVSYSTSRSCGNNSKYLYELLPNDCEVTSILKTTEKAILFGSTVGTFWIPKSMIIHLEETDLSDIELKCWKDFKLNIIKPVEKVMIDKLQSKPTPVKINKNVEIEEMVELISMLVDPDDCQLDHHNFCQAHGHSSPCPHKLAKDVLRKYTDKYDDESQIPF
jgi:hypothetical protein